jgi:tetratricopeptide (TPR) repeat protein
MEPIQASPAPWEWNDVQGYLHAGDETYLLRPLEARELTPSDREKRAAQLGGLSNTVGQYFERTRDITYIDRAIEIAELAERFAPLGHDERSAVLSTLANNLSTRYDWTDAEQDLHRAIQADQMAIKAAPPGHRNRGAALHGLGLSLGRRFDRTQATEDLDEAIEVATLAINAGSDGGQFQVRRLMSLSALLGRRFEKTEKSEDIDLAISKGTDALRITPPYRPERLPLLCNLIKMLTLRFSDKHDSQDVDLAAELATDTLRSAQVSPSNAPQYATICCDAAELVFLGCTISGRNEELGFAINLAKTARGVIPSGHPVQGFILSTLGRMLTTRFCLTEQEDDYKLALSCFRDGWESERLRPKTRIGCAVRAAELLALRSNWEDSSRFLKDAIDLLPVVSPWSLHDPDKEQVSGSERFHCVT